MERVAAEADIFFDSNNTAHINPDMVNRGLSRMEERKLVERVVLGDMEALGKLAIVHQGRIFRQILRRVGNTTVAEDLLAGTIEKAIKAAPSFEIKGPPFVSWLLRIAHNQTTDHLRAEVGGNSERVMLQIHDNIPGPEVYEPHNKAEIAEDLGRVRAAVAGLKDLQRDAIMLRFFGNMGYGEIAEKLGITDNFAKVSVHRGLKTLKKQLQELNSVDIASGEKVA